MGDVVLSLHTLLLCSMDIMDDVGSLRPCPTRVLPAWLQETALQGQAAVQSTTMTNSQKSDKDEGDELKFVGSGCIVTDMERKDLLYKIAMQRRKMFHLLCAFQHDSESSIASLNVHCMQVIWSDLQNTVLVQKYVLCLVCSAAVPTSYTVNCDVREAGCLHFTCLDCAQECPYCDAVCCVGCWFPFDEDDMEVQSCCLVCAVEQSF